jgi:predicted TIM-barrel fold metal-dependent hydrolase
MSNYIDADAHVDECEETWSFLPKEFVPYAPKTLVFKPGDVPPPQLRWNVPADQIAAQQGESLWFIDGQVYKRFKRNDERTETTRETRELHDVGARLGHMDALGIAIQVLYPSLFLAEVSRLPEVTAALIPFASPTEAIAEMEFARENGACAVSKRTVEGGRSIGDPAFFSLYEVAASLDLPLCVHQNREWLPVGTFLSSTWLGEHETSRFPVLVAFYSLLRAKIPQRIPNLRFGFIESASSWLPYLLDITRFNHQSDEFEARPSLADLRYYVTCEFQEDLPYLIGVIGGDDNLIIGTDYSHNDKSSLMHAHELLHTTGKVESSSARKITSENARVLYGL